MSRRAHGASGAAAQRWPRHREGGRGLFPIDIIPGFIPVLGLLDDLLLAAVPIAVGIWLVPAEVVRDCRERVTREPARL